METSGWWGASEVPVGEIRRWQLGPTVVLIERVHGEWRVVLERGADALAESPLEVGEPHQGDGDLLEHPKVARFGASDDDTTVHVSPRSADRAVVTRPVSKYAVPAGERVSVWVTAPLWIAIEVGAKRRLLMDVPIFPPSNTWFGSSPAEGELCYASRSVFRPRLSDILIRPHRSVTTLHIHNQASHPLQLERVSVPVPYLPLYVASTGALWTPEVTLSHRDNEELAPLEVGRSSPKDAEGATRLTPPRQTSSENMLVRAFSSLFAQ